VDLNVRTAQSQPERSSRRHRFDGTRDQILENLQHGTRMNLCVDVAGQFLHQVDLIAQDFVLMYSQCRFNQDCNCGRFCLRMDAIIAECLARNSSKKLELFIDLTRITERPRVAAAVDSKLVSGGKLLRRPVAYLLRCDRSSGLSAA
jgi:hypothetical protein